jgi:hypothetical protein
MSTNIDPAGDHAELLATEPGAISICLVGKDGVVAGVTRLRISGPAGLVTRMDLPLSASDGVEVAGLIPVVVYQSNRDQKIRLMGIDHSEASMTRARALGCSPDFEQSWRAEWERRERDYWTPNPIGGSAD